MQIIRRNNSGGVINQLIKDGFPLKDISNKFNAFYKGITSNQ